MSALTKNSSPSRERWALAKAPYWPPALLFYVSLTHSAEKSGCVLGEDDCAGGLRLWHWVMRRRLRHLARIPWVDEDCDERRGRSC